MNGGTLVLAFVGLAGFFAGVYLSATGERTLGIALMGVGLLFQMLTLRQLKRAKKSEGRVR
ncbi:MAG: hypothetical protein AAF250_00895 [Pseudomonadota bacterium]